MHFEQETSAGLAGSITGSFPFSALLNLKSEEPANHALLPHSSLLVYEDPSDDPITEKGGSEAIAIYQKLMTMKTIIPMIINLVMTNRNFIGT
jgi:hypothetical protein